MNVYADNAATTRMSQAAVDAMLPFLRESYGSIGVCALKVNGVIYWVQLFGK